MTDPVFSQTRIATPRERCPLVVAGLPRSGSSFLSEVISQLSDWYVFDDLYTQRHARDLGAGDKPLTGKTLDDMLFWLGWQIRARHRHGTYAIPGVQEDEVEAMNAALKTAFTDAPGNWAEIQEEWMMRLAHRAGAANWGYKMPQAFRSLDRLLEHYPNMRVIFLMRRPDAVLASYKFMPPESQDGDPRQYHPVAHAYYWRMAAQSYLDAQEKWPDRVTLVRFEDLVKDPTKTAQHIAGFIGAETPSTIATPPRPNTSFNEKAKRKSLSGLELFLIDKLAGRQRDALGFDAVQGKIGLGDFWDAARRTVTFSYFRIGRALRLIK